MGLEATMRNKILFVILMLLSASLAGCTSNDDDDDDDPGDTGGGGTGGDVTPLSGALFVYIQSGEYAPAIIDENGPLYLHFPAPPMADESPYLLEKVCSVEEGHLVDVYQTWVNSSGGNAGDFHEITSWSVKNSASPGIQLEMFAYTTMSDIIGFENPMVVFEDNESLSGGGHLPAEVFDQATWSCTDAVDDGGDDTDECPFPNEAGDTDSPCFAPECEDPDSEACDEYVEDYCTANPEEEACDESDDGGDDECPFPNEPGDTDSPCFAPECEDHESEACEEYVEDYCEANPDEGGCEMFEFMPIMDFMDSVEMDVSGLCGTLTELGTSMIISGPMMSDEGDPFVITFTRLVEYDNSDTRSMMWYQMDNPDEGFTANMGLDTITFTPSYINPLHPTSAIINLHMATSEDAEDGGIDSSEYKLILRDNYTESTDFCEEFGGDDDESGEQTYWCSSSIGGAPDTEISFELVNDGTEDCGDGADEPQDMDPSVDSDGDGVLDNDADNWLDCNDEDSTTVPMNVVNDGSYDCPNGADEMSVEMGGGGDMDLPLPNLDGTACGGDDDEDDEPLPTSATMEGPDGDGVVYVNMTFGDVTDADYCSMEFTVMPVGPDSNMTMLSMVVANATTTIAMYNWFEVDLNKVEVEDGEWTWGAADLTLMTTDKSIHMFDCGDDGVMGDDGEVIDGSQWIIFKRVNDNIADCVDQSDEAIDSDGDGASDTIFHCETPEDPSDDINMALVNDGNAGDCPNYSDEYSQTGSSYGTFNWDSEDSIADGFSAPLFIFGFSEHDIPQDHLEVRIVEVDSAVDNINEEGHCGDMNNSAKESLTVLLSIPFEEMGQGGEVSPTFTDTNGKNWIAYYVDNDENGYVNSGDAITLHSSDTTDLYFTCVEIHDDYVDMYTGDTPNLMTLPGFTAVFTIIASLGALMVICRRD